MQTKTDAVRAFLDSRAPSAHDPRRAALITMAAELAGPALHGAGFGTPAGIFDSVGRAVRSALDVRVAKVVVDTPGEAFDTIRYSVDYADSLGFKLGRRHWPRLAPRLAETFGDGMDAFKDDVWRLIARATAPQLSFWDDPFAPPRYATTGESLCTTLFYFVSFAAVGDGDGMESLANLVRWLPRVVPIGERPAGSGEWLIAMRPALR